MAEFFEGLRKMFTGGSRQQQLEQQEQQIVNPQLRQAPVQAAPAPIVPPTGIPEYDAAEQARMERQQALEQELMRLRGGQ